MTETDKLYYKEMVRRNRLLPIFDKNNQLRYFITFYIGGIDEENKFIRDNPWSILEDDENKDTIWVDQIWGDKEYKLHNYSFEIWKRLINFIKFNYPNIQYIHWNRWKNNKLYKFRLKI